MLVMKFGGSSVADRAQIEKVQKIVQGRLPKQPVVICSAHKGITNMLIAAGHAAAKGQADTGRPVIEHQRTIALECGCSEELLEPFFQEITDLLRGVRLVRELSPRSLDYISSFGERMSVRVIADLFTRNGLLAQPFDVWDLGFITDGKFGMARPLPGYQSRMKAAFDRQPLANTIPIITGFIGKTELDEITTVGRNGSDLTATLVATALKAEEVEIWSDTDGIMSADPRLVKGARNIPAMSFDEAAELAYFGSRMLHPETLIPAIQNSIPVRVLNTNRPEHPGTVITRDPGEMKRIVTSIAYKENQGILTVRSERMLAHSGFLSKLFEATTRRGLVVDMVATSEVSVSLSASDHDLLRIVADDIAGLGECRIDTGKTILTVVGHHLPKQIGTAAHITSAVADAGVNIKMLSYASDSINLSMVIDDKDVNTAVRILHTKLFEQ